MRQDVSEEAFNQMRLTAPKYHPLSVPMDEPLQITQSRQSPQCHKAALEVLWNTEDIVIFLILSGIPQVYSQGSPHPLRDVRPWETLNYTSINKPIHPGVSF
jgi:hypothetical protein